MKTNTLLLLCALTTLSAHAGQRETFDFDWQFKYFGPGNPPNPASAATASSEEGHNPAAYAIDGNENTRWCAANASNNQSLSLRMGKLVKASQLSIVWENDKPKNAQIILMREGKQVALAPLKAQGKQSSVKMPADKAFDELQVKITQNAAGSWASIREISLTGADGKALKPELPKGNAPEPAKVAYKAKGFKKVQLPHDWAVESAFLPNEPNETGKLPWNGYGWYRKSFEVPANFSADNERYYLDFDGVMSQPQIYVNGQKAGEWAYGYSSFRVDITPYLKAGQENVIAVRASNKYLSTRWYPGAGIYRHVWLEKTAPVHIAHWGVFVTTPKVSASEATINIRTTVDNTSKKTATLTVQQSIGELKSKPMQLTLAAGESKEVTQEITMPKPKLWDVGSPNLYTVHTSIEQAGKVIDTKDTRIGVRTIEWKPDGFYLNGRKVYLKGVCEHHDLGALGAAFYKRGMQRKIEILQSMGCNSIRTAHNPPAPEMLELCDEMGVLVIDESFDIWKHQKYDKTQGYHVYWQKWWKKDIENFVKRDRNHPSIIAWSGGNEVTEILTKDGPAISAALRDEFRKYDTTRPYTGGVNGAPGAFNGFGDTMDSFGYNYKPWLYVDYAKKRPHMSFYASETSSCVGTRDTYFFPKNLWDKGAGFLNYQVSAYGLYAPGWANCPDVEFKGQDAEPRVAGEYVWTGFDYIGEPTPYNQDNTIMGNLGEMSEEEKKRLMEAMKKMGNKAPSRSSYFGIIDLAGYPKDTYYLYQSRWAPEVAQAHILPHWNWESRKGKVTPVMVFSSGDEAELFLNGKSQGVRKRSKVDINAKVDKDSFRQNNVTVGKNEYRFTWEDVIYQPGELKVVVKKDGKPWATATRQTTGKTTQVTATPDRKSIVGDGRDLSYVDLSLKDAKGRIVPTDSREVSFSISGPAELIGFCNGNPVDQQSMQDMQQVFFNGRLMAIVRGNRGESGKATITVKAKGLPAVKVPVTVTPASAQQLQK